MWTTRWLTVLGVRSRGSPGRARIGLVNGRSFGTVCNADTNRANCTASAVSGSTPDSAHQRHHTASASAWDLIVFGDEVETAVTVNQSLTASTLRIPDSS